MMAGSTTPRAWRGFGQALEHYASARIDAAAWDRVWDDFNELIESQDQTVDEALLAATHTSLAAPPTIRHRASRAIRTRPWLVACGMALVFGSGTFFLGWQLAPGIPGPDAARAHPISTSSAHQDDQNVPTIEEVFDAIRYGSPDSPQMQDLARRLIDYLGPAMMTMVEDDAMVSLMRGACPVIGRCPSVAEGVAWLEGALTTQEWRVKQLAAYWYMRRNPDWQKDARTRDLIEAITR